MCYRKDFVFEFETRWIGGEERKCIGDECSKILFGARELNHSILGGGVLSSVALFLIVVALSLSLPQDPKLFTEGSRNAEVEVDNVSDSIFNPKFPSLAMCRMMII